MSKCNFTITFSKPDRIYTAGDEAKGTLNIVVNEAMTCKKLTLRSEWRTHGKGNVHSGDPQEQTLAGQEEWGAGSVKSFAFQFAIPAAGPVTYHGHYLNVDWYIAVEADTAWALNPKHEEEFFVTGVAAASAPQSNLAASGGVRPQTFDAELAQSQEMLAGLKTPSGTLAQSNQLTTGCGTLLLVPFLLIGFGSLGFGVYGFLSDWDWSEHLAPLLVGAAFTIVPLIILFILLRNQLAERTLGAVSFTVDPKPLHAGSKVKCTLAFTPKSAVNVEKITFMLRGEENATSGSGTKKTTYTHQLHEEIFTEPYAEPLSEGQFIRLEKSFALPANAAPTFLTSSNTVKWELHTHIYIKAAPDWTESSEITVLPPVKLRL